MIAHRLARTGLVGLALGAALSGGEAQANPNRGEARNLTRDGDRVYGVVAGEADGSATIQNPANLGYLNGLNGIIDVGWTAPQVQRRGSGAGAFLGIPVRKWFAVGFGYQYLSPVVTDVTGDANLDTADRGYNKFTMALGLPLMRWAKGLSLGVNYSRMFARENFWAANVNQIDVGISWWANRIVALGLSARGVNQPRVGPDVLGIPERDGGCGDGDGDGDGDMEESHCVVTLPASLVPEIAFRPGGTDAFELAIGASITPFSTTQNRFNELVVQPRARMLLNLRGVRVFADAEGYAYNQPTSFQDSPLFALRLNAGLGFDLGHFGMAAGPIMGFASPESGLHGGVARVRISQERYRSAASVRPRTVIRLPLGKYKGERGTYRLTREIEKLGRRGAGILLIETKGLGNSYAQLEEIREAVLRFRGRGGKVVVYMEGASLRSYFLASAADRIICHPHTALAVVGMSLRTLYYGDLIKRLGGNPEFVRIAEYKGTPEVYADSTASEPVKEQRRQMLSDAWNHALRLIARERGRDTATIDRWIDTAPHRPQAALDLGMIDDTAWPDEVDEHLEDWLGKKVRIESPPRRKTHARDYGPQPQVAVLYVEGDLVTGPSFVVPFLGRKYAGSDTITKQIKKLRKDDHVRAIVVRISSRGGSVVAAEAIARELDLASETKPIVVSFGSVAASGGYYIATAGDYIVSDAMTITGSIGIFYPKVDLSGFLEKFGVGVDIDSLGDNASLRSWFKPYSEGELAAAQRGIQESYDIFVERVANARAMTPEEVDQVARGRIWSGARAIEVGLVDRYGGLREAVIRARAMAGMKVDEGDVVQYPPPPTALQNLRTLFGLDISLPIGQGAAHDGPQVLSLQPRLLSPVFSVLEHLPGAFWASEGPEALALSVDDVSLE